MAEPITNSAVSATVWPWRRKTSPGQAVSNAAARWKRVLCESAITGCVALLLGLVWHKPVLAGIALAVATFVLLSGLLVEPLYRAFKEVGHYLAVGVGVGMTWLLLVPFFYICFTMGRLILVLLRKDPLNRQFPTNQTTYWSPYRRVPGSDNYRRQY